jgi:hypothetical protein
MKRWAMGRRSTTRGSMGRRTTSIQLPGPFGNRRTTTSRRLGRRRMVRH